MAVIFDFQAGEHFHFASAFGQHFDREVTNNRVSLPEMLGKGFIQEVYLDGFSLCLHRYTLWQELVLRRHATAAGEVLTMKFDGRESYSVELGTSNFFTELRIPADVDINFLVIVTTRDSLLRLLGMRKEPTDVESTIRSNPSFVLHETMSQEMERALQQIGLIDETTILPELLYQTKAQELVYLLFTRLFTRKAGASISLNLEDVERIYRVRAAILADLSVPPQLPELARNIGMSPTKMKQLFRQIFGDSIYNYFQGVRMNEAARLLRKLSVSQVGYSIGFSNLSHFTRLFEKHHQMKPKRYKDSLEGRHLPAAQIS